MPVARGRGAWAVWTSDREPKKGTKMKESDWLPYDDLLIQLRMEGKTVIEISEILHAMGLVVGYWPLNNHLSKLFPKNNSKNRPAKYTTQTSNPAELPPGDLNVPSAAIPPLDIIDLSADENDVLLSPVDENEPVDDGIYLLSYNKSFEEDFGPMLNPNASGSQGELEPGSPIGTNKEIDEILAKQMGQMYLGDESAHQSISMEIQHVEEPNANMFVKTATRIACLLGTEILTLNPLESEVDHATSQMRYPGWGTKPRIGPPTQLSEIGIEKSHVSGESIPRVVGTSEDFPADMELDEAPNPEISDHMDAYGEMNVHQNEEIYRNDVDQGRDKCPDHPNLRYEVSEIFGEIKVTVDWDELVEIADDLPAYGGESQSPPVMFMGWQLEHMEDQNARSHARRIKDLVELSDGKRRRTQIMVCWDLLRKAKASYEQFRKSYGTCKWLSARIAESIGKALCENGQLEQGEEFLKTAFKRYLHVSNGIGKASRVLISMTLYSLNTGRCPYYAFRFMKLALRLLSYRPCAGEGCNWHPKRSEVFYLLLQTANLASSIGLDEGGKVSVVNRILLEHASGELRKELPFYSRYSLVLSDIAFECFSWNPQAALNMLVLSYKLSTILRKEEHFEISYHLSDVGDGLYRQGRYAESRVIYEAALPPKLALDSAVMGRYGGAVKDFAGIAACYLQHGDNYVAIQYIEKAINCNETLTDFKDYPGAMEMIIQCATEALWARGLVLYPQPDLNRHRYSARISESAP